jgi:hypothetical protein
MLSAASPWILGLKVDRSCRRALLTLGLRFAGWRSLKLLLLVSTYLCDLWSRLSRNLATVTNVNSTGTAGINGRPVETAKYATRPHNRRATKVQPTSPPIVALAGGGSSPLACRSRNSRHAGHARRPSTTTTKTRVKTSDHRPESPSALRGMPERGPTRTTIKNNQKKSRRRCGGSSFQVRLRAFRRSSREDESPFMRSLPRRRKSVPGCNGCDTGKRNLFIDVMVVPARAAQ